MEFTMLARTNLIPVVIEHAGVSNTYNLTATVNEVIGVKILNLAPREHPVVGAVESGKPAAAAGLQPGDKILSINGIPVPGQDQVIGLISKSAGKPFEIIFVNDGSKDKTLEVLKTLKPLKIINLRKNFGQTAAMDAGIKAANGLYLATLDGDGQNDPADIPALIAKLEADDLDVAGARRVHARRKARESVLERGQARLRRSYALAVVADEGQEPIAHGHAFSDRADDLAQGLDSPPVLLHLRAGDAREGLDELHQGVSEKA